MATKASAKADQPVHQPLCQDDPGCVNFDDGKCAHLLRVLDSIGHLPAEQQVLVTCPLYTPISTDKGS